MSTTATVVKLGLLVVVSFFGPVIVCLDHVREVPLVRILPNLIQHACMAFVCVLNIIDGSVVEQAFDICSHNIIIYQRNLDTRVTTFLLETGSLLGRLISRG